MNSTGWASDAWSIELADRFFSSAFAGEPVTFAVDGDALASIHGSSPVEAQKSLCAAVRAEIMPGHHFERVQRRAHRWQLDGADGPPPSLPVLGLTVLAAASMDANSFYGPLRRLLDPDDPDKGIPPRFEENVPWMWGQLSWWLGTHLKGSRGVSTISDPGFYVNIGYSLQQAAMRASDRRLVFRFFRAIGLQPQEEQILPSELRRALAVWAKGQLPRTARLLKLATDASLQQHADVLLEDLARSWDGRLRDPQSGSKASPLRLRLELSPFSLGWIAPRSPDDPNEVAVAGMDGPIDLLASGDWWAPEPLPLEVEPRHLDQGLELVGDVRSFFHDARQAIPFRYDDSQLEHVSVDRLQFGEKHLLLVRGGSLRAATESWMAAEGVPAKLDPRTTQHLPAGWFLFKGVRLDARPSKGAPAPIRDLLGSAGGGARLRLVGGLKLKGLGRVYLTDAGPDLAIPDAAIGSVFSIHAAGFDPIEREAGGHDFPLSKFASQPGTYEVSNSETSLSFEVVDGVAAVPSPRVGSVRTRGRDGLSARGLVVDGAASAPPSSVPVPAGGDVGVAIGPTQADVALVEAPKWFSIVADVFSWSHVDLWKDFEPVWLLTHLPGISPSYVARLLHAQPPAEVAPTTSWGRLLLASTLESGSTVATVDLWDAYQAAAGKAEP